MLTDWAYLIEWLDDEVGPILEDHEPVYVVKMFDKILEALREELL